MVCSVQVCPRYYNHIGLLPLKRLSQGRIHETKWILLFLKSIQLLRMRRQVGSRGFEERAAACLSLLNVIGEVTRLPGCRDWGEGSRNGKNSGSGTHGLGLCLFLTLWCWVIYLSSLLFNFPISKMGFLMRPSPWGCCADQERRCRRGLTETPNAEQVLTAIMKWQWHKSSWLGALLKPLLEGEKVGS